MRKSADDGPFQIFTDTEAKLEYYRNITGMVAPLNIFILSGSVMPYLSIAATDLIMINLFSPTAVKYT